MSSTVLCFAGQGRMWHSQSLMQSQMQLCSSSHCARGTGLEEDAGESQHLMVLLWADSEGSWLLPEPLLWPGLPVLLPLPHVPLCC